MKKKLLVLPIMIICVLAGIIIGGCGNDKQFVNANNNFLNIHSDAQGNQMIIWTDEETGNQYLIYSNYKLNIGGMCPRYNADGTLYTN